ncbi:MAG: NAD-dependent epimerase/dehydratase family protein [Saprospiraceae bacterium]|nr:NAD-dependent epimerase/dehydratase family protein [Saprospiraceae bacterium]
MRSKILITGCAGFIGFHLTNTLSKLGYDIIGIDNINDYYSIDLKLARLTELGIFSENIKINKLITSNKYSNLLFSKIDIRDESALVNLLSDHKIKSVCHLAAQAGVRFSMENPQEYIDNNITGFLNILNLCKKAEVNHLIYASSSSVYGLNNEMPLNESMVVNSPINMYAVSKITNELMAHSYSKLYNLKTTGLRFFTVYGPWGRPDMAPFIFTRKILAGEKIDVYNNGNMERDFTYIDDIIEGIIKVLDKTEDSELNSIIYNIGCSNPVKLNKFINIIERILNKNAIIEYKELQPGEMIKTFSASSKLKTDFGYQPTTDLEEGLSKFIEWYNKYYKINN